MRPAYAAGVRGALAVVAPLIVLPLLGLQGGLWMSIAALHGVLSDRGGAYRTRAITLAAVASASALVSIIATVGQGWGGLALVAPIAFIVAAGSGLTRAWGPSGATAGMPVLITFLVALAVPFTGSPTGEAVERAAFILAGGGWAMLLTLSLWPLSPYRPVRQVVAHCYRELAEYIAEIRQQIAAGRSLGAYGLAGHAAAVRRAVERAREVLAGTRRGRPNETKRGARLLELYEIADRCFVHAVAIADAVETVAPSERGAAAEDALAALLAEVAATMRALGDAVETEQAAKPIPVTWNGDALRSTLHAHATGLGGVHFAHIGVLVDRMAKLADTAAAIAAGLETEWQVTRGVVEPGGERGDGAPAVLVTLRAALAPGSLVRRYSFQLGLVTMIAVVITALFKLPYGHWMTITAVIVLQPYTGATTNRAIQRILGAVLGGALAAGLSAVFHDPMAIVALVAIFVALCVALLPLSYAAFSAFITPAFVLLVEVEEGSGGLAWLRVVNTLLGGALALAAARLIWPQPEWSRFPFHLATVLRASREYLEVVTHALTPAGEATGPQLMREARRKIGLAAINAEESFQRLLGEYRGPAADLEPAMALLGYIRRFGNSVAALALARHSEEPGQDLEMGVVAGMVGGVLEELADALVEGRAPADLPERPELSDAGVAPLLRARQERLVEQVEGLHHAVARWGGVGVRAGEG